MDATDDAIGTTIVAADTVFGRCCAVNVSTTGTPVMTMMAISAPARTHSLRQARMTTARSAVQADERQRQDAVPELHDRVEFLDSLFLPDRPSRVFGKPYRDRRADRSAGSCP